MDRKEEDLMNLSGTKTNLKSLSSDSISNKKKLLPKHGEIINKFLKKYSGRRNWRFEHQPVSVYPGYTKNINLELEPTRDLVILPPGINGSGAFR